MHNKQRNARNQQVVEFVEEEEEEEFEQDNQHNQQQPNSFILSKLIKRNLSMTKSNKHHHYSTTTSSSSSSSVNNNKNSEIVLNSNITQQHDDRTLNHHIKKFSHQRNGFNSNSYSNNNRQECLIKWRLIMGVFCLLCVLSCIQIVQQEVTTDGILDFCRRPFGHHPAPTTTNAVHTLANDHTDTMRFTLEKQTISTTATIPTTTTTTAMTNKCDSSLNLDACSNTLEKSTSVVGADINVAAGAVDSEASTSEKPELIFYPRPKSRKLLFSSATIFIVLSFAMIAIKHVKTPKRSAFFLLLFTLSWYHISWGFIIFFKQYLNDHKCNIHPNSISGHYHFFVFTLLTLPFLFTFLEHESAVLLSGPTQEDLSPVSPNSASRRAKQTSRSAIFYVLYGVLLMAAVLCMIETYNDGYHSLRQILYGSFLAVASHFLLINVLTHVYSPDKKIHSALVLCLLFVVMIYCNSTTGTVNKVLLYNVVGLGLTAIAAHLI